MEEPVIGIDLGTTHSEVAYLNDGQPAVISVAGSALVPSVVSLGPDGELLVGQAALNNELNDPVNTVRWIKRKMGTEAVVTIGGKAYTPAMISSLILRYLKQAAEVHLGKPVSKAVVTVPAFFGERAREDTREAARLAGLEVLRLVNEPTAAALAYAMGNRDQGKWLVYDLGGGTFDVSVVDCSQAVMEVRASHGDVNLGGHDFDRDLAHRAAESFKKQHGIDLHAEPRAWARLVRAAEQAKIRLSSEAETVIREEYLAKSADGADLHLTFPVRRTELEAQVAPAIERTISSVRQALAQADCLPSAITRVLLVGGVTRMPLVAQLLRSELQLEPQAWINPDTVVAQGAAIEAATLCGAKLGAVMVDITPHTLGVGALTFGDVVEVVPLIRRNTPLPSQASEVFFKRHEDQDAIEISIYQGESRNPAHCMKVGEFHLDHLGTSASCEVHCRFDLDRSGILTVHVTDLGSGKALTRVIERPSGTRRANLADLASVRVAESEQVERDESVDEWAANRPDEPDQEEADDQVVEAEVVTDDAVVAQAESVLARTDLDAADREELSAVLAQVRAGADGARQRLADLVYFLQ